MLQRRDDKDTEEERKCSLFPAQRTIVSSESTCDGPRPAFTWGQQYAAEQPRGEQRRTQCEDESESHQGHMLVVSAILKELSSHQDKDRKCSGLGSMVGELGASRLSPTSMHLEVKVSQSVTKDSLAFSL